MASDEVYILVNRWYKSARAQSYREPLDSGPLVHWNSAVKNPVYRLFASTQFGSDQPELAQCA